MTMMQRLLIVDDEPAILFAFSQFLSAPDVQIETTESSKEALDLIERVSFNAAIVDLRLTGATALEGWDVVAHLKARQPSCIVMVVTAFRGDEIEANVERLGVDYYFEKPVSPEKLKDILTLKGLYSNPS